MLLEKGENQRVLKVQRDAALLFVVECKNAEQKKAQKLLTDAVLLSAEECRNTEQKKAQNLSTDAVLLIAKDSRNTEQKKAQNLLTDAVRQTSREWEATERANTAKETTLEECRQMFLSKVSEGPIYACCSCLRLHYRSSVVHMKTEKYKAARSTAKILKTKDHPMTHDATWICNTCNNALKAGRLPTQSWANDLQLDDIPPALQGLRPLEIRLISQCIPFMKLVALPRGGQKAIHGSAVNVPSKVQSITTLLPRLPETAEVFAFKLKRKLAYKGHYMYEYV